MKKTPFKPNVNLENLGPEVKSYIYQTLQEFEPYCSPQTIVSVIAKDPLKLISRYEADGIEYDHTKLKKMWRISISLAEEGSKIQEEGVHEDIYGAIRIAKEKLLKNLAEIQDAVISNQDRTAQINMALGDSNIH